MTGRGRPPRRGRRGRGAGNPFVPRIMGSVHRTRTLNAQNSEDVVEWLTQDTHSSTASARNLDEPSFSSSSSSGTTLVTTRPPGTTTNTSTTAALLDPSEELFSHQFEEMSDAQTLLPEDAVNRDMSLSGSVTHMEVQCDDDDDDDVVPAAASFLELSDTSEAVADDDVSVDATWVPARREEEEEGESSDGETERRRRRVGSSGRLSQGASGTVRQHASPPGVSQTGRQSTHAVATTRMPSAQSSAVWHFFCVSASDNSDAICNLCQKKLSRGKSNTHLGTTALRRHMSSHHKRLWDEHMSTSNTQTQSRHPPPGPAPASSSAKSTTAVHLAPSQPSASPSLALRSSCSPAHSQVSVKDMFERKKTISQSHPLARRLTAGLSELLARQLLPYKLVESKAFQKFVAIGTPQWKVPGRNFFAQKAIPNLYSIVQKEIMAYLAHSVGATVHLTTDAWSAKHGQGRYITYTAHWVNLVTDAKHGEELLTPPRLARRPATTSSTPPNTSSSITSSAESSSTAASCSTSPPAPPQHPRCYSSSRLRQCHAILGLTCLKGESHTAQALLSALNAQVDQWLTPHQLEIGKVVSDNGANLVAALKLGKLTHVPCMAHVCNLIVQRFVHNYPGLQDVLKQARKVCGHFRRSYTAMAHLSDIQRRNKMPVRRLICDSPTRWNSTLLMFDRLLQQEKAVNEYLYERGSRTSSAELGIFFPRYWTLMRNACRVMRPFEEVTNLVSRSEGSISDIIAFSFFLERALRRVVDEAVEEREEEELWSPSPPPQTDLSASLAAEPAATPEEDCEEEESEEECGFEEEEEEEDQPQAASQGACCHLSGSRGVVRGWGGEDYTLGNLTEEEEDRMMSSSASSLVQMGSFMLSCLLRDPRIKSVRKKDLYWLSTLLDPRYKHKVAEMLPHNSTNMSRMQQLEDKLKSMLYTACKGHVTAQRECNRPSGGRNPTPPHTSTLARRGCRTDMLLMEDMQRFLCPTYRNSPSGSTLRERLDRQVADYLALTADIDTVKSSEPLQYWVCRLDLWPELSQFALELLACPASSVLSERTFSAAGGIVTEKRSRLGPKSLDYLTFIKMNEGWIPKGLTLGDTFE